MSDLVRVRANGVEFNAGRALAERKNWQVLDGEPTHRPDGRPRPTTRANGRPVKPKTSVAEAAAEKKSKAAVIGSESAPTEKETDR
jgi:hypothetical protein